jgi:hypothetical protein
LAIHPPKTSSHHWLWQPSLKICAKFLTCIQWVTQSLSIKTLVVNLPNPLVDPTNWLMWHANMSMVPSWLIWITLTNVQHLVIDSISLIH